jgi:uncharacterized membrane protein
METHTRTLAKCISYRIIGTLVTMAVSWLVTRRLDLALTVGGADVAVKIVVYYAHERLWDCIRLGRRCPPPDYSI